MDRRSSLSEEQREAAIAWFELGHGSGSTATVLGVARDPVNALYRRWRIRGGDALVNGRTAPRSYSFELKLALVERALDGELFTELAAEAGLSSPKLLQRWARDYRRDGPDALRPKPRGRQSEPPEAVPGGEGELERLRRENELLRAKVAYLGKLKALREQPRD
ncbi:transposase [Agrococcus sp. Ld7]|uniref:transposase n=1 Tax=Agrococcus sp. Ld7 TaxID=649148 RepID=UPI00386ED41F